MTDIKIVLEDIVKNRLIIEVEAYIDDLHKLIENDEATDDDLEAIRDMESFLVELENILLGLKEEKINDEQAQEIYNKISKLIDEHKEH